MYPCDKVDSLVVVAVAMLSRIFSSGLSRTMLSVGTSMFFGDATIQQLEQSTLTSSEKSPKGRLSSKNDVIFKNWNVSRSVRMGMTGILVSGPISHISYTAVSKLPYLANLSASKKVFALIVLAPVNISASLTTPSILCGVPLYPEVYNKWKTELLPTLGLNTIFWPLPLWTILTKVKLKNRRINLIQQRT